MITSVPGIRVGCWTDPVGLTGCTVVLCPPGTVGSGEVRGGAPGTRETDLLRPGMLVEHVHAVLLAGGSAFGLAAADGVMRYLEERGIGFETSAGRVPIVPAAVLFDLGVGDARARPGPEQGYAACLAASEDVPEGNAGAGTGATVAKLNGPAAAVKGGQGTAFALEGELVVGAVVAVNAAGEVLGEDGTVLTPSPGPQARGADEPAKDERPSLFGPMNTTLAVVATNARLSRERANLLARSAHDAIDEVIRPAHTIHDGDTVFTLATGAVEADQRTVEGLAGRALAESVRRAVRAAVTAGGVPALRDLPTG